MPSHLIKMKNSYFQREFFESTEERISTFFNFSDNENLLCAVWTASFLRYGFVVSDKALYWFLKTSDGIKSGGIPKNQNAEFQIAPYISSENSVASLANSVSEECSKLEIRANGKAEEFYIRGLGEEKGKTLCDILKFAFTQGELPQADLGELVKTPAFVPLRNFCDEVLNIADESAEKIADFKNSVAKGFHEITHIQFKVKRAEETETPKSESKKENISAESTTESKNTKSEEENSTPSEKQKAESESPKVETTSNDNNEKTSDKIVSSKQNSAVSFLLNLLDICASLVLLSSIVVLLKKNLLTNEISEQFSKIGLAVYTVLKCTITFYSKKTARKIIALILVVISILSYILLSYTLTMHPAKGYELFIVVSVALCLLSYFAFEFACGFKTETVFKKIITIIVLECVLYIMACFAIYEQKEAFVESACRFWQEISKFAKTL